MKKRGAPLKKEENKRVFKSVSFSYDTWKTLKTIEEMAVIAGDKGFPVGHIIDAMFAKQTPESIYNKKILPIIQREK